MIPDLAEAVASLDLRAVKAALKAGAAPDGRDAEGEPLLRRAVARRKKPIVRALLSAGYPPNLEAPDGSRALHWLARSMADLGLVEALLEAGAEVDARDQHGQTALHLACEAPQPELAELLLERGADIEAPGFMERTPLYLALSLPMPARKRALALRLVEAGADVNHQVGSWTPLRAAADYGDLELAQRLVAAGASAAGTDALLFAMGGKEEALWDLLVAAGADPHARFTDRTLLMYAAESGDLDGARWLLKVGADKEATFEGLTAWDMAHPMNRSLRRLLKP